MKTAARSFYLAAFSLLGTATCERSGKGASPQAIQEHCAIDSQAIVSDACASFSTLDQLNNQLKGSISSLTQDTDFFSYYRLNLYNKECPFWSDESGMCGNIACAVNTIDNEEDIPPIWRAEELGKLQGPKASHPNRQMQKQRPSPLMGELGADVGESCVVEYDDECDDRDYCVPEDESATGKGDYVSLAGNPERFTGYSGPGAQQVWEAIYRENCFSGAEAGRGSASQAASAPFGFAGLQGAAAQGLRSVMKKHEREQLIAARPQSDASLNEMMDFDDACLEERVFYRVISGMHSSISTHLCWDNLNQTTGEWGPNLQCYEDRLHNHPERISNLYFNYALVLRAVAKARSSLQDYVFCSGDPVQDGATKQRVLALADQIASGPSIYDESLMFQDSSVGGLKEDFRNRFRNVSRIMDCVGCDKCRLWGKVQTNGYGTALKILFEFGDGIAERDANPQLRRTELVALVNTLDKLSHSLSAIGEFEKMLSKQDGHHKHGESEREDDGLDERAIADEDPETDEPKSGLQRGGEEVWDAFVWVINDWIDLPSRLFRFGVLELSRLWDMYLGFEPADRVWEIRQPGMHRKKEL